MSGAHVLVSIRKCRPFRLPAHFNHPAPPRPPRHPQRRLFKSWAVLTTHPSAYGPLIYVLHDQHEFILSAIGVYCDVYCMYPALIHTPQYTYYPPGLSIQFQFLYGDVGRPFGNCKMEVVRERGSRKGRNGSRDGIRGFWGRGFSGFNRP